MSYPKNTFSLGIAHLIYIHTLSWNKQRQDTTEPKYILTQNIQTDLTEKTVDHDLTNIKELFDLYLHC